MDWIRDPSDDQYSWSATGDTHTSENELENGEELAQKVSPYVRETTATNPTRQSSLYLEDQNDAEIPAPMIGKPLATVEDANTAEELRRQQAELLRLQ